MEKSSSELRQLVKRLHTVLQTAAKLRKDHARLKQEFESLRDRIRAAQLDSQEFATTAHLRTPAWLVPPAAD